MRHTKFALALLTAAVLAACGGTGSSGGDQTLRTKFSAQITFGDSLSDVGTYNVGTVKALGGGKFTINGDNTATNPALTGKNYTELLAAQFGLPAPCPAQTGLDGLASQGFAVPVVNNAGCYGYAQGGSRVSNPVGTSNKATGSALGALTVPVSTQIARHLVINGGKFASDQLVIVMAGGNDVLNLLTQLKADSTAAGSKKFVTSLVTRLAAGSPNPTAAGQSIGLAAQTAAAATGATSTTIATEAFKAAAVAGYPGITTPEVQQAIVTAAQADGAAEGAKFAADTGPSLVASMAATGAELATMIKTQLVAKGANYVVVNNVPDVANTPSGKSNSASTQTLIAAMVDAFNAQLKAGVASEPKILLVDVYAISHDQVTNPGPYGLTNTSTPACGANKLGTTSLVCNSTNVIAGDVSHYMFADDVHPTPFEYSLLAKYVAEQMTVKGWL
ncbi:SGNH/GDSL hydrolase family protein [Massilia sp. S19_KUP03_FR1]|uniref:SGNH/GDSL hydrolase family protein n=1 Tax=Massilia sp. S19_KUP03_FR1 TaxID=3025503 RepID=UPI002FCDB634